MANLSGGSYRIRNSGNTVVSESEDDSEKDSSEIDEEDDDQSWKRRRSSVGPAAAAASSAAVASTTVHGKAFIQSAHKFNTDRKLNVWTQVLEQRALSENLHSAGVIRRDELRGVERGSESYAYPALDEGGPAGSAKRGSGGMPLWKMDSQEIHRRLGLKRSRKDRRRHKKPTAAAPIEVDAEKNSEEEIVHAIATLLKEPKQELIARSVSVLGKEKALELLRMTEDIEAGDGIMTADGSRRRTPGGVFLLMVRNDRDVTKDQLDLIFEEDRKLQSSVKKEIAKAKRRIKTENLMDDMKLFPTREELILEQARKETSEQKMETSSKLEKEPGELSDSENEPVEEEEGEMK